METRDGETCGAAGGNAGTARHARVGSRLRPRSVLRRLVPSGSALAVSVLLLASAAAPGTSATSASGADENLSFERVRKVKVTTTTVAPTTTSASFAGFETGDFTEVQMNQSNNGSTAIATSAAAAGTMSATATVNGGVNAQYARVGYSGPWNAGQQVVYKGSFMFPTGFFSTLTNQMDLMRFDNWDDRPTASEQTGLTVNISGSVKKLYLFRNQLGTGGAGITYIAGPFELPSEGVWHNLEVRQTLSGVNGTASNALYVDGVLQGSSVSANMFGSPGNRYNWFRAGIVSSGGTQTAPIRLYIDNLSMTKP